MKRQRTRKGAPGIIEVAQRAGVSAATVSRFFNTPDIVRAPTRNRIEKAASDLGYIRDRMAGTLHNRFSGTMGLVVPTIDNAIFAELIEAFSARLQQHDRTMLIAAHGYDLSLEVAIIRSLLERRIDGVAVIGLTHETASLEMLATRNVPVLAAWNYRPDSQMPCIGADNFDAGYQVARHLIEHGHRDIGLLFPPTAFNDRASDRLQGAFSALAEAGISVPRHRVIDTQYDIGEAKQIVGHLLENDPPTALLCGNDIIAHGAIYACHLRHVSVPQDMSIIGIGDFRGSAHIEPPLTTVRLPARRIGESVADQLCFADTVLRPEKGNRVLVPSRFIRRNSVTFPPSAAKQQ
ncbi:MAG: substrate-binding domain-containing protein [Pseudomonadota bacterium]